MSGKSWSVWVSATGMSDTVYNYSIWVIVRSVRKIVVCLGEYDRNVRIKKKVFG